MGKTPSTSSLYTVTADFPRGIRQSSIFGNWRHKVKVVSITQPVGDENEPVHAMMRKVIALFDEYQSRENANTSSVR